MVATNEPAIVDKSLLDSIVMENSQGDGSFANSAGTDESDWAKALNEIDCLLD